MNAIALIAALILGQAGELPLVEQDVDTIAVCHVADGWNVVFFFDRVQGEWACLDHRWLAPDMAVSRDGDGFTLAWHDESDACYRVVHAAAWVESWERESPLVEQNNRPWHARLLEPGLKHARGPL